MKSMQLLEETLTPQDREPWDGVKNSPRIQDMMTSPRHDNIDLIEVESDNHITLATSSSNGNMKNAESLIGRISIKHRVGESTHGRPQEAKFMTE